MPLYSFICSNNHETDEVYRVQEKPEFIRCSKCGKAAKSFINCTRIGSCWPEGRVFPQVKDENKVFKNYNELEKYVEKSGCAIETLSPSQLTVRQEERRHKISKGENPSKPNRKKKLKVPEKVDRAFRSCPTVESAVRALKEDRV